MAKVDFRLNLSGLNELMKSSEMQNVLNDVASQIAVTANANASPRIKEAQGGYEVEPAHPIRFVAVASVSTGNFPAMLDNSRHNTLRKAMDSVKI